VPPTAGQSIRQDPPCPAGTGSLACGLLPRAAPELPQPRQPIEVVGTRPHSPPAISRRGEPPAGPGRRFGAVRRL
jgi:hypothetical protein